LKIFRRSFCEFCDGCHLLAQKLDAKGTRQTSSFSRGNMSKNIRELSEGELNIVSGGFQSAAFGAIVNNSGGCSTRIPSVTNSGFNRPLGYGGLTGSFDVGGPCSDDSGPLSFTDLFLAGILAIELGMNPRHGEGVRNFSAS
jgi:hypothetical protein